MLRMAHIYGERFADPDARIRATFDVIWREPAAAAAARFGQSKFGGGGEEAEVSDVATQCDVILRCALLRASKDGYGHIAAPPPFEASAALRHLRVTAVCDLVQVSDLQIRNRGHPGPISDFRNFA